MDERADPAASARALWSPQTFGGDVDVCEARDILDASRGSPLQLHRARLLLISCRRRRLVICMASSGPEVRAEARELKSQLQPQRE